MPDWDHRSGVRRSLRLVYLKRRRYLEGVSTQLHELGNYAEERPHLPPIS